MIAKLSALFLNRQFVKFLAAGGTAAALQWTARFIFSHYFAYSTAVPLAYLVGLVTAYALNILFVFQKSGNSRRKEVLYFIGVNLLALPVVWGVSILFGSIVLPHVLSRPIAEGIGNGIGILSPVIMSFVLHKKITFRED